MRLTILLLLIVVSSSVGAQTDFQSMNDVEQFKKNLSDKTSTTNSIVATFKQEKFMSILTQQLISDGSIQYKTPNKVKWSYSNPYLYNIILNGKEIIIDDDGKVNAFSVGSSKMFSEMNQLIVNSVQGNVLDESKFTITYLENEVNYLCKLRPRDVKQLGAFLKEIHVHFNKKDFSVDQIKLVEPEGDYTQISFSNKKFNQEIPDAVFEK